MHTSLECSLTGEIHDLGKLQGLSRAGKPLLARYDLQKIRTSFTPAAVKARSERSMWKFHDVLPVDTADQAISLGVGLTSLLTCLGRGPFAEFEDLLVNGLISDCGRLCRAACDRFGWFDLSTLKEPFRMKGKKTMGYKLAFDLANHRKSSTLQWRAEVDLLEISSLALTSLNSVSTIFVQLSSQPQRVPNHGDVT